ncbi:hypothetical protein CBL_00967 [Carabus blaptoides fortunei]
MASLPSTVLFLLCAFHLQDTHSDRRNFHYFEHTTSSSSSVSKTEGNFRREISLVNNKANAVMFTVCDFMQGLDMQCSFGTMDMSLDRKFFGRYSLNFAGRKATRSVSAVLRVSKTCPQPEIGNDPKVLSVELGTCFLCAFRPKPGGMCY